MSDVDTTHVVHEYFLSPSLLPCYGLETDWKTICGAGSIDFFKKLERRVEYVNRVRISSLFRNVIVIKVGSFHIARN